jgi:hypothetical protein
MTAVVKCLAASHSRELQAHRESWLRVLDNRSFRDERIALGTKVREHASTESTCVSSQDNRLRRDGLLVRICFWKMRGR